jgi:hypothetical protein
VEAARTLVGSAEGKGILMVKSLQPCGRSGRKSIFDGADAFAKMIAIACIALSLSASGCVKLASNLLYVLKGRDVPAEFGKLEEKRVAVVVNTQDGTNADAAGLVMARQVHTLLGTNVKKITMINPDEVDQVVRDQSSGSPNMARLGRKLGADYIVAVELKNLKLREGATLYRGSSECSLAVYEMEGGERPVYRKELPPFTYPGAGLPVTDMDESKFRAMYLTMLSGRVARTFYPYDPSSDVAIDATAYGFDRF